MKRLQQATIKLGADCRVRSHAARCTPLGKASLYGHPEVVKRLLSASLADLDTPDDHGCTPLMGTCIKVDAVPRSRGHLVALGLLLEARADVDAMGEFGTALHMACDDGLLECCRLLIKSDCDTTKEWYDTGKDGASLGTALDVAERGGHTELAAELPKMIQVQRKKKRNQARKQRKEERDRKARAAGLEPEPELDDLAQSELAELESIEAESKQGSEEEGRDSPPVSPVNCV